MLGLLLKSVFFLLRLIPVRLLGACGAGLGRCLYFCSGKFRTITLRNLQRAYPQHHANWHRHIARESFAELGRTMLELPHVFMRSRESLSKCVDIVGLDDFLHDREQHQGAILAAAHHSNWELGGLMVSSCVSKMAMIYRPMKNHRADAFLRQCRERFGMQTFSRFDGIRWLPGWLRQQGVVAIMVDQHMSQGMQIPFMGHLACTTTLPAVLSMRQNIPIYSVSLQRIGRGFRFQLCFQAIELPRLTGDKTQDEFQIMHSVGLRMAEIIHQRPELWLWLHKRWWILEHDPNAV